MTSPKKASKVSSTKSNSSVATPKIGDVIKKSQSDVIEDFTLLEYPLFRINEGEIPENDMVILRKKLYEELAYIGVSGDFSSLDYSANIARLVDKISSLEYYRKRYSEVSEKKHVEAAKNLGVLLQYLNHRSLELTKRRIARIESGEIFFFDIVHIFKPGDDIYFLKEGSTVCGKIESISLEFSYGVYYYYCRTSNYLFAQTDFYSREDYQIIKWFDTELIKNLKIQKLTSDVKTILVERGKKYVEFTKASHVKYNPHFAFKERRSFFGSKNIKVLEQSRCVVDFYAFAESNENHSSVVVNDDQKLGEILGEELLHYLPSVVPGYSLSKRYWFEYDIDQLEPVVWNDSVFDKVVLNSDLKKMILTLVSEQKNTTFTDIVENKGKGIVFLLSGPTGVGKTLIAEAVSESTKRPLVRVSLQDLGISPEILEKNLERIFQMAEEWNGVFLFDECDVFLEERRANDLERNAIVAAFLRHLEYFNGILFLTTNSENNLDPAVMSRVTLPVKFPNLQPNTKVEIWKNLFKEAGIELNQEDFDIISKLELPGNGRQIKNAISTSLRIARNENRKVTVKDLSSIIELFVTFVQPVTKPGKIGKGK